LTIALRTLKLRAMRIALYCILASVLFPVLTRAQTVPVVEIDHKESSISFYVKASVALAGKFDKWEGKLAFSSTDVPTGVLDIKIEADSVDPAAA
jgi:polyisoprenoid-binding protein YceI